MYYGFNAFSENISKISAGVNFICVAAFSLIFLLFYYINAFWIYIIAFYSSVPLFIIGIVMFSFKNTLVIE